MQTLESLERLAVIARRAGAEIMRWYANPTVVELKADRSPLTAADTAAHRLIEQELREWTPAIPIISEEGAVPPYDERRTWRQFWLVDPLDGTKEFLNRHGDFTVNVALVEGNAPVLGVVFAPALDLLYLAGAGLGAWCHEPGAAPRQLSSSSPPAGTPLTVVESRSHPSPELESYLQTINVSRRVRAGSSLKFCWVAEGKADLYPRFGPTMEWDTAAGDCVYRQSGRSGERTSPLRYNTPSLRHDRFVIGSMPESSQLLPEAGLASRQ